MADLLVRPPVLPRRGIEQTSVPSTRIALTKRMAEVDLNTVRELLGHTGITMALRYARLEQKHLAAAVEKLASLNS
jgi:integrase